VNVFASVGRKFILLLACSILRVYKGLDDGQLAVTNATAQEARATPITASDIFLSVLSPPFTFVLFLQDIS